MISDFWFIKDTSPPICLYREAIRLQCFTPTCYVKTGDTRHARAYYGDDLYPICSKQHCREYACIVWLNYALKLIFMHVATLYGQIGIWRLSGFGLSSYTRGRKKNNNLFGALGNTWRYNIYDFGFFYSHLYIKDTPTRVSPMFVQGSHMFAMFYAHARVKNGEYPCCTHMTTFTQFTQNSTVECILTLYGSTNAFQTR